MGTGKSPSPVLKSGDDLRDIDNGDCGVEFTATESEVLCKGV